MLDFFSFVLNTNFVSTEFSCKYVQITIDSNLLFNFHVAYVVQRLGKQCETIGKLRHFVSRLQLLNMSDFSYLNWS